MAAAAGLRALGAKGSGWLQRGPWAPLTTGFCSRGPAGIRRPEPGPRPTIARQRDGIRNIILSDPKRRNALSLAMLKSLQSDILHEAESQDLKVIIISAEGPVFSSGHDLKELTDEQGPEYHAEVFQTCSEVMMLIQSHPVPIIAMVNGLATAAGCQLVASCDIAVASDKSSFATPGVNIGLFCSTPAVALGRAVPRKQDFNNMKEPACTEKSTKSQACVFRVSGKELFQVSKCFVCYHVHRFSLDLLPRL
ncbi:hypothetical protein R6Z07M_011977 [Ovis aries]